MHQGSQIQVERFVRDHSFESVIDALWFDLKALFEERLEAGVDFETYIEEAVGPLYDKPGAAPLPPAMTDRFIGTEADKLNPRGAFFLACIRGVAAELLREAGQVSLAWGCLSTGMYWLGHARLAFLVEEFRDQAAQVALTEQARKAGAAKKRSEQHDAAVFAARELAEHGQTRSMSAAELARKVMEKVKKKAEELGQKPLSESRIYQVLVEEGFPAKRK